MRKILVALVLLCSVSCATVPAFYQLTLRPANVVERTESSIVRVTGRVLTQEGAMDYVCSGFFIQPHVIMTAAHCISLDMQADGHTVKPIKANAYYDLAILDAGDYSRPSLTLRPEPLTRFHEDGTPVYVTAIGYAYGWTKTLAISVKVGLLNYQIVDDAASGYVMEGGYIGGMSGGPVVDDNGLVVSIVQRGNEQIGYGVGTLFMLAFLYDENAHGLGAPPASWLNGHLNPLPFVLTVP